MSSEYHPTVTKIKDFLNTHGCTYKSFEHEAVRTSEEAAQVRPEYSLKQGAKALIIRIKKKGVPSKDEKQFVQLVVPGDARFDPKKARAALRAKDIRFATPEEVENITGGIQPGGIPPFGNLFGLSVYVDQSLLVHDEIIFNAGDRRYSIAVNTKEYVHAVQPVVLQLI